MGAAIWLGRLAGNYVMQIWGLIIGIISAMVIGLGMAFIVGRLWSRISQRFRIPPK